MPTLNWICKHAILNRQEFLFHSSAQKTFSQGMI
jgi:hypothetical protein